MSGRVRCVMCGRDSDSPISRACTNEYEVCGPWEDVVGEYATAHAAGYAEAVASIVVDLRRQAEGLDLTGEKKLARYVGGLASRYADSAHVGAAKKGGG